MEIIGDQWIMKGCDWDSPGCVRTPRELVALVEEIGFLPLFSNTIPGFSAEEHTPAAFWWTGDPERDPWEWRQVLARDERIAYGKFFDRKAGFLSREWFPIFANYRRNGYDFDALWDDALVPNRNKKLMDAFETDDNMVGLEWLSSALKERAGFGKGGEKNYEGVLAQLQMQTYLIMSDFRQKRNKRGESYGWHLAALETPETKWGYEFITSCYGETPEQSWKRILARMGEHFPRADEAEVKKMLGIRYPDQAR